MNAPASHEPLTVAEGWRSLPPALVVIWYLSFYVLLDWASFRLVSAETGITPWNPAPGVSLALLFLYGLSYAPTLLAAGVLADLAVRGSDAPIGVVLASNGAVALGYAACAAVLMLRFRFDMRLERTRDLLIFLLSVPVAAAFVSGVYVGVYTHSGLVAADNLQDSMLRYWVGDVLGMLLVTPPLLIWLTRRTVRTDRPALRTLEILVQMAALTAALILVFRLGGGSGFKEFYFLFPPLVWIAARHGLSGAALAAAGTQFGLILGTLVTVQPSPEVTSLQLLMGVLSVTVLFLGSVVDERRAMEAKLRAHEGELAHMARVNLSGEMASGLAHEINQPLSAVVAYARACRLLLQSENWDKSRIVEGIDKAVAQAERAGAIVRKLRAFLTRGENRPRPQALAPLASEALELIGGDIARNRIIVKTQWPRDLPLVLADRIQIEQVLLNLLRNAVEAISSSPSAKREIRLAACVAGELVEISVEDDGPGIAPDMHERLFMPFATSKSSGMGLGLSISRSIIEAHGGRLWEETSGPGATFRFTLPIAEEGGNDDDE